MMQRLHGSVAKQVNDVLETTGYERRPGFWKDTHRKDYFDGAIRDEKQARLAYRYTMTQGARHGAVSGEVSYPHTRVHVQVDAAIQRSLALGGFLAGVRYKRYQL
ncbi:MAG: hypothetical protein AAGC44_06940 [Planctomycetota bacterium]